MDRTGSRLSDYIDHILSAIARIQRYTSAVDETRFLADELLQDAVLRNFEVIGEASRCILRDHAAFAAQHPGIAFTSAYQMRNAIAHGYDKVDLPIIWRTLSNDLPQFQLQLGAARAKLPPTG